MTVIKTFGGERPLQFCGAESVEYLGDDEVAIGSWIYPRADVLKAVADELDVIVIERSELPEVTPSADRAAFLAVGGELYVRDGFDHRAAALRNLAIAECLDANLPVDDAQVESVIGAFVNAGAHLHGATFEDLVRAGIRAVEVTP